MPCADPTFTSAELIALLQLHLIRGVGPILLRELLAHFGSAEAACRAGLQELTAIPNLGQKRAHAIHQAQTRECAEAELARCQQHEIQLIVYGTPAYPQALATIPDPPVLLFEQGQRLARDEMSIAVVGTRHASRYGLEQTRILVRQLVRAGCTIVSGLARGVDTEAHQAALEAGGRTLAVIGSGLLSLYPPENRSLAERIGRQGAVLSELPSQTRPSRISFPRRNRIVSGLAQGVLVIEAGERSGALISARLAGEQGREVFALPGPVTNRTSRGCHRLLREGAKLVETARDVLEELGPLWQPVSDPEGREVRVPGELLLNEMERRVLTVLADVPQSIDDVAAQTELPVHRVLAVISVLEMRQLARRLSATLVQRIPASRKA